jgi:hypothetical protein
MVEVAVVLAVVERVRPDLQAVVDREVREFLIRLLEVMSTIVAVKLAFFLEALLEHMVLEQHKESSLFVIQHKKGKIICL